MPESASDLSDDLVNDLVAAVTLRGRRSIALLGYGELSCSVYASLHSLGLHRLLAGIYDSRPERQGGSIGRYKVASVEAAPTDEIDLLCVCEDGQKEQLLRRYAALVGPDHLPEVVLAGVSHFNYNDPLFEQATGKALVKSTATGSPLTLIHLFQCLRTAARLGCRGAIAEFGMYKGGTTVMLARMARALDLEAPIFGFDSFSGFPPRRSLLDLYADPVCEYTDLDAVRRYCEPYGIEIVAGDISDMHRQLEGQPLILSFFDTDNYSPTRAALPLCIEQTVPGGSIVFDHYHSLNEFRYTLGERMAAHELLAEGDFFHLHGTGVFTRIR